MRMPALLFAAYALTSGALGAQEVPTRVVLPKAWRARDRFQYVMEREHRESGWPRGLSRTPITLEVLERSKTSFLFGWTYGRAVLVNVPPKDRALAGRLANVLEGIRLDIRTDRALLSSSIENRTHAAERIREASDGLIRWMREQEMPPETIDDVRAEFKPFLTPRIASIAMMKEPSILLMALARNYEVGERYEYDGTIDNPFPGGPIPSPMVFWLMRVDPKQDQAIIGWRKTMDSAKASKIIKESMIELARRMDREIRPGAKFPTLQYRATATIVIDMCTGLPISCRYESKLTVDGKATVRRYRFQRSDGPAAEGQK